MEGKYISEIISHGPTYINPNVFLPQKAARVGVLEVKMCPHFPFFIRDKYGQCCVARVTISLQRCLQEAVVLHGLECNRLPTCIQIKSICMHVADAYVVILFLSHTLPQKYFGHLNYI